MSHNTNNDFPYSDDGSNSSINQNNFCFNDFSTYNLYNYFQDYSSSKNIQDVVTLWDKNNKEKEPYLPNDNNNNSINRDNLDINNNFKEDIKHFNNDNESEESKEDKSSKRNDEKALFKLDYLMPTMNQTQKNKKENNQEKIESEDNKQKKTNDNPHTKYTDDNMRRKCKFIVLSYVMDFINHRLAKIYEYNIGNGINKKQLKQINKDQTANAKIGDNKNFMKKKIKEIFSEPISGRFTNYPLEQNEQLIQFLLNEKDEKKRTYFQSLFNLTFLDCVNHFIENTYFTELKGLKLFNEMKNDDKELLRKKIDLNDKNDYLAHLEYYFKNYEIILGNKKPRIRGKNKKTNKKSKN